MSDELSFDGYNLTEKEKKRYRELQRKARARNRVETKFWKYVDDNREAVIKHLGLDNPQPKEPKVRPNPYLEQALAAYGCSEKEFFQYVLSERQLSYYHNTHR